MPWNHAAAKGGNSKPVGIFLEIEGEIPLEFSAIVRNFTADQVTLEVPGFGGGRDTPALVGRGGSLRLVSAGSAGSLTVPGTVSWVRETDNGQGPLTLGLRLEQPNRRTKQALVDHLPHAPRDIQGLWERWEQAKRESAPRQAVMSTLHHLAGLGLLVGGLTLQLLGGGVMTLLGEAVTVYGAAVIAGTGLWWWWRRREHGFR